MQWLPKRSALTALLCAGCLLAFPALAAPALAETVEDARARRAPALVLEVIDGDTLRVEAAPWPGDLKRVLVRLADIDTPELRGKCAEETRLAEAAKAFVEGEIGARVVLRGVRWGTYAGRVVAGITTEDGHDLAEALLAEGLARPYEGRGPRASWCE